MRGCWGAALALVMAVSLHGCSYREAPKKLTFQGKSYALGTTGRYEFVDRNLYFLPGEDVGKYTLSVDLSRVFDKKRSEAQLHSMLKSGLVRAVRKVFHEREDGTRWCVVYLDSQEIHRVSYHVTGEYKHGFWSTDFSRVLDAPSANESACDDSKTVWQDLEALGLKTL